MKCASLIFLLLTSVKAFSGELRGYSIVQGVATENLLRDSEDKSFQLVMINRLNYFNDINNSTSFEFGLEIAKIYEDNNLGVNTIQPNVKFPYRIDQINHFWFPNSNQTNRKFIVNGQIDRLMFTIDKEAYNLTLGRQPISFGSAKTVNPLDVFTPFGVGVINTEERNGVDGIRVRVPYGEMGQWDFALVLGEEAKQENSALYGSLKFVVSDLEAQLILMEYNQANFFGLDLVQSIKGSNVWIETAYTKPDIDKGYLRLSTGFEYQWNKDLFTIIEYHYNEAGAHKASEYLSVAGNFAYTSGGVYLLSKNYLNFLTSYVLTDLDSLIGLVMFNLDDNSIYLNPSWNRSLSDESTLSAGLLAGVGPRGDSFLLPRSEFGSYGTSVYIKYSRSF